MTIILPWLVGGIVGLISLSIVSALTYSRFIRLRVNFLSELDKAEKELIQDIEFIGAEELQQTEAGISLLVITGRQKANQLQRQGWFDKAIAELSKLLAITKEQKVIEEIKAEIEMANIAKSHWKDALAEYEMALFELNKARTNSSISIIQKYKIIRIEKRLQVAKSLLKMSPTDKNAG